jgi:rubredoxin
MERYRCSNCGYSGDELIYQFNDYTYCVASNDEEPDFIDDCPSWVKDKGLGDAEIGQPVGCPECHAWGVDKFEEIE